METKVIHQTIRMLHDFFDDIDGVFFVRVMDNHGHGSTYPIPTNRVQDAMYHVGATSNVYFTPTVFKHGSTNYVKEDVLATKVLRVDIDNPDEIVVNTLLEHPLPPTYIINSGGGYHAYWLLKEPYYFKTEEHINIYEHVTKTLLEALGGDMQTKNVNRLMRLPGSKNYKYNPPKEVTILHKSDYTYDMIDFMHVHQESDVNDLPDVIIRNDWKTQVLEMVEPFYTEGSRHVLTLYLAGFLRKKGIKYEDALDVITQLANKTGDKEIRDRHLAVAYTYNQDIGRIKGYYGLKEINENLAVGLAKLFKDETKEVIDEDDVIEEMAMQIINEKLIPLGKSTDGKDLTLYAFHKDWNKLVDINVGKATVSLLQALLEVDLDLKTARSVRNALVKLSRKQPYVDQSTEYGRGVWRVGDNMLIANMGEPKVIIDLKEHKLDIADKPIMYGKLFRVEKWIPHEYVEDALHEDNWDTRLLFDSEVFKHWYTVNWKNDWEGMLLHAILTIGFAANHLSIRPFVYILGYSGSGKTWLFEKMRLVTQNVVRLENTTFASRMIQLNNNMVFPLFNDFEPTDYNMKIIEEWKQATLGNAVITRSTANHVVKTFTLFHIPIFNSVNLTVTDEAIFNRIITLRLEPLTRDLPRYDEINYEAAYKWMIRSLIISPLRIPKWNALGQDLMRKGEYEHIDTRMKNGLAPIVGLLIEGGYRDVAEEALAYYNEQFAAYTSTDTNIMSEYSQEIFVDASIRTNDGTLTVSDLVYYALYHDSSTARNSLKQVGLWVVEDKIYVQLYKAFSALGINKVLPNPSAFRSMLVNWGAKQVDYVRAGTRVLKKVYDVTELFTSLFDSDEW